jgi:putative addiction module component (TIGR02574 family)
MATKDKLLTDVLQLSPEERAEVAHKLLLSLDEGPDDVNAEAAWSQELERRAEDIRQGRVKTVPWEEVEARITGRLKNSR